MGKIKAINISNLDGENTFYINQAILNKNKGIVNDRYYGNFKNSYEQVTFIESEKIDDFNKYDLSRVDCVVNFRAGSEREKYNSKKCLLGFFFVSSNSFECSQTTCK